MLHDIMILLCEINDAVPPEDMMPQGKGGLPPHPHPEQDVRDKWAMWQVVGIVLAAAITTAGTVFTAWLGFKGVQKRRAQS